MPGETGPPGLLHSGISKRPASLEEVLKTTTTIAPTPPTFLWCDSRQSSY